MKSILFFSKNCAIFDVINIEVSQMFSPGSRFRWHEASFLCQLKVNYPGFQVKVEIITSNWILFIPFKAWYFPSIWRLPFNVLTSAACIIRWRMCSHWLFEYCRCFHMDQLTVFIPKTNKTRNYISLGLEKGIIVCHPVKR